MKLPHTGAATASDTESIGSFQSLVPDRQPVPVPGQGSRSRLRFQSLQLDGFAEIEESIVTVIDFEYPDSKAIEPLAVLSTIAPTLR